VLDSGRLFFGNTGPTGIASIDPSSTGIDGTLSPVVHDSVTVSSIVVSPVVTRNARRHAKATGTVTPSAPSMASPFTVFPADYPSWVAGDGAGTIYFRAGVAGDSIARLSP
jgi:hypothetical protein